MRSRPPRHSKRANKRLTASAASVVLALLVAFTAMALASSKKPLLDASSNAKLGQTIVVDPHGITLYYLSPESSHHLLCTSQECLKAWHPLTVPSKKAKLRAKGVHGRLGLIHRHAGAWQVTLRGLLLYRFIGDNVKGETNGDGISSFGGTWHVVAAGGAKASPPAGGSESTTTTSSSSTEYTPPYTYPTASTTSSTTSTSTTTSTTTSYTYTY
jgi:predicted lipoprotein with Yx(FWY)xxD motif